MNEYVLHLKDIFHSDFFLRFFKSLHVEGIAEEGKGTINYLPDWYTGYPKIELNIRDLVQTGRLGNMENHPQIWSGQSVIFSSYN